ncbi:MAG: hypothetical protein LC122_11985 [Chitinophagales bacterium]|nr:hypothetical protein [Chitinophagales bacterium]
MLKFNIDIEDNKKEKYNKILQHLLLKNSLKEDLFPNINNHAFIFGYLANWELVSSDKTIDYIGNENKILVNIDFFNENIEENFYRFYNNIDQSVKENCEKLLQQLKQVPSFYNTSWVSEILNDKVVVPENKEKRLRFIFQLCSLIKEHLLKIYDNTQNKYISSEIDNSILLQKTSLLMEKFDPIELLLPIRLMIGLETTIRCSLDEARLFENIFNNISRLVYNKNG